MKPPQRIFMVAIIKKGGAVISIGYNNVLRKSYKWKKENSFRPEQGLHAEMDALNKYHSPLKGATIEVYGSTYNGNPLSCTKPCASCRKALLIRGVKKLIYMNNGQLSTEKI
jgi:deoxycytidylate deaminase